jgi:hypothetical protein
MRERILVCKSFSLFAVFGVDNQKPAADVSVVIIDDSTSGKNSLPVGVEPFKPNGA